MTINVLGDLHFRSDLWWSDVAEKFLSWFEKAPLTGSLIQLGDITDKDVNPGDTLDLVYRFSEICVGKFDRTYLLVGNHDRKLYKGREQYSFKFLDRMPNVTVIDQPKIYEMDGCKVGMIPFVRPRGMTIDEYYETSLHPSFYSTEFDLLVGHLGIREKGAHYGGIDVSKFKFHHMALGHIHSRSQYSAHGDKYVGSVAPFKVNEEVPGDLPRIVRVYSLDSGSVVEEGPIEIPRFMTYDYVRFPDEIPPNKSSLIRVFTVGDCKNIFKARAHYPDHHVRAVEKRKKVETEITVGEKGKVFLTKKEALSSMIRETGLKISRPVHKYVIDLLDL